MRHSHSSWVIQVEPRKEFIQENAKLANIDN